MSKKRKELKENLYISCAVFLILLCCIFLQNYIPWQWLRQVVKIGCLFTFIDIIDELWKYFKFKKTQSN